MVRRASPVPARPPDGARPQGDAERTRRSAGRPLRFWDASAIVPLLVADRGHVPLIDMLEQDPVMLVWWGTPVECVSAIARREREHAIELRDATAALNRLRVLSDAWQEVLPSGAVRTTAQRLLRVHALRAADSLQLAAALVAGEHEPGTVPFVSMDQQLSDTASREGFPVFSRRRNRQPWVVVRPRQRLR